jgi:hypothetical protein
MELFPSMGLSNHRTRRADHKTKELAMSHGSPLGDEKQGK